MRRPRQFLREALRDLAEAPSAAWLLFRAYLRMNSRRTLLGYIWLVIPALATAAFCTLLRTRNIVQVNPTALPYPLFVLSGMLLWQTFVDGLLMPQQQLAAHRQLFARAAVSHEVILVSGAYALIASTGIRIALLAIILLVAGLPPGIGWFALPLGAAFLAMLGLAAGLFCAPFGMLYDDVSRLLTLFASFGLLLAPVLYPVPPHSIFWLNPATPLIDGVRSGLVGDSPHPLGFLIGSLALVGCLLGWLFYRLAQPHLVSRA